MEQEHLNKLVTTFRIRSNSSKKASTLFLVLIMLFTLFALFILIFPAFSQKTIATDTNDDVRNTLDQSDSVKKRLDIYIDLDTSKIFSLIPNKLLIDSIVLNKEDSTFSLYFNNEFYSSADSFYVFRKYIKAHYNAAISYNGLKILNIKLPQKSNIPPTVYNNSSKAFEVKNLAIKGIAIILIAFLILLLFRCYQYHLRLSKYYLARADAIELQLAYPTLSLKECNKLLSPDTYYVGNVKISLDHITEMIALLSEKDKESKCCCCKCCCGCKDKKEKEDCSTSLAIKSKID